MSFETDNFYVFAGMCSGMFGWFFMVVGSAFLFAPEVAWQNDVDAYRAKGRVEWERVRKARGLTNVGLGSALIVVGLVLSIQNNSLFPFLTLTVMCSIGIGLNIMKSHQEAAKNRFEEEKNENEEAHHDL